MSLWSAIPIEVVPPGMRPREPALLVVVVVGLVVEVVLVAYMPSVTTFRLVMSFPRNAPWENPADTARLLYLPRCNVITRSHLRPPAL